ncbi:MAG: glycosyltransferase family 2 protein [Candidatus Peribacter sp.]|nr:glycosyltransferase family 2 protein [Candidatus Peribacter sp.]
MRTISVVTPTFNEEANVRELYRQTKEVFAGLPAYRYEHIFIDNASTDRTVAILKEIAATDPQVKVIVNARNFGHIRSPYYGLLQASGDAAILIVADLQDPPSLIPTFVERWEQGEKIVIAVKTASGESPLLFAIRKLYYRLVSSLSETPLIRNFSGFGLYDRSVLDVLRTIQDPYPYFRGLVLEVGPKPSIVPFQQPQRKRGISKNNFYTLYDIAMLGITSHSKVPLRIATIAGFFLSAVGLLVALGYLVAKLVFWNTFSAGIAPIVVGGFIFFSIQLFFIGLIGEYVAAIHTQTLRRPLVTEKERVNF